MKEDYNSEKHRGLITVLSIIAVLLIGVGIFFYYSFFRQTKSELIEAVPTDAIFLYEVNDNASFTKDITPLLPYFNELFSMEALPAFETMYNALPTNEYDITLSGHPFENRATLLFNMHMEKNAFKRLLKALSIAPENCEKFEQQKIYTYGTNFQKLYFVYFNHILSITTNKDLLKKAVFQHLHPKNLLSVDEFKKLYDLAEKNKTHNWIFINAAYMDNLGQYFKPGTSAKIQSVKTLATWGAFQLRIASNEVFLSGYVTASSNLLSRFGDVTPDTATPEELLPYHACWYHRLELPSYDICYFSMPQDSAGIYPYMLVRRDTLGNAYTPFADQHQVEAMMIAYPNGIFPVNDSIKIPEGSTFDTNQYKFFTCKSNGYLFATSENALSAYNQDIAGNGNIGENRFYKFAKGNIASNNLIEFTLYNTAESKPMLPLLNELGAKSRFGQELRIFSFTFSDITDGYATVNIYLNFLK